jgi:hypothetical protein
MEITYRNLALTIDSCTITITDFGTIDENYNSNTITSACVVASQVLTISFTDLVDLFNYDVDKDPLWLTSYEFTYEVTLIFAANISFKTLDATYLDVLYKTSFGTTPTINESFYGTADFVYTKLEQNMGFSFLNNEVSDETILKVTANSLYHDITATDYSLIISYSDLEFVSTDTSASPVYH